MRDNTPEPQSDPDPSSNPEPRSNPESASKPDAPTPEPAPIPPPPLPGVRSAGELLPEISFSWIKRLSDEEWEARKKAEEAEQRRGRIARLQAECNAPTLHWKRKNLGRNGPWGETEKKIKERLGKDGLLMALVGLRGNGKTQLGVEAIRHVTTALALPAYFATAQDFINDLKASWREGASETERDVIRRFRKYQLLVSDEFARRGETDWENNQLFDLLNKRYGDQKDTILIANQERAEFIKMIGPSLASRMSEMGAIIECDWPSYR